MLQRRPNTFAQNNLLPHFSLATKRRTIHSGLPVTREESPQSDYDNYPQIKLSIRTGMDIVMTQNN